MYCLSAFVDIPLSNNSHTCVSYNRSKLNFPPARLVYIMAWDDDHEICFTPTTFGNKCFINSLSLNIISQYIIVSVFYSPPIVKHDHVYSSPRLTCNYKADPSIEFVCHIFSHF